jgi:hypothetical protein
MTPLHWKSVNRCLAQNDAGPTTTRHAETLLDLPDDSTIILRIEQVPNRAKDDRENTVTILEGILAMS